MLEELRRRLVDVPVDVNVLRAEGRRKKLLLSDMDATAIIGETLDELSTYTPHKAEIDNLTRQSVNGLMSFTETLVARMQLMRGLPEDTLAKTWSTVQPTPGMTTAIATMRAHGAYTALVSGGFTYFTSRVRDLIGFDCDIANDLEIVDGRLTGRVPPPIVDPAGKVAALQRLAKERGLAIARDAGDRRRLQRHPDAAASRPRHRLLRQAEGQADDPGLAGPRRPDRAAVSAGVSSAASSWRHSALQLRHPKAWPCGATSWTHATQRAARWTRRIARPSLAMTDDDGAWSRATW